MRKNRPVLKPSWFAPANQLELLYPHKQLELIVGGGGGRSNLFWGQVCVPMTRNTWSRSTKLLWPPPPPAKKKSSCFRSKTNKKVCHKFSTSRFLFQISSHCLFVAAGSLIFDLLFRIKTQQIDPGFPPHLGNLEKQGQTWKTWKSKVFLVKTWKNITKPGKKF